MKRSSKLIVMFTLVACLFLLVWIWASKQKEADLNAEVKSAQTKTLKFIFDVVNDSNRAIKGAKFETYLPVESASQSVLKYLVSVDYSTTSSDSGNRVLQSDIGLIAPYATKQITIAVDVESTPESNQFNAVLESKYLSAERYIETGNDKISSLAIKLKGETQEQTAQNIYDWVIKNIRDSGYVSQDKGASYALETRSGDCTEFMYLTVALARAAGIHARGVGGYVYKQSTLVKSADYHNWAELYYDDHWHVVDGQKKRFQDTSGDYVSMRYLSDKKLSLHGSSHRFSVVDESLTVRMR